MHIQEYADKAIEFNKPMSESMQLFHAALGMTSEAGEFGDAIKAALVYGKARDDVNLIEELGDLIWFANLAANTLGYTLEQVLQANLAKLSTRYDDGYADAKALGRNKELEREAILRVLS